MTSKYNSNLSMALGVAVEAHDGQMRKDGQPYITHPIRVMSAVETTDEKIVAILHDVVEDTDINLLNLRLLGFSAEVIAAVDALTRRKGETYMEFIDRCNVNPIAKVVKIADIDDNMSDMEALKPEEAKFLRERYIRALEVLL